MSKIKRGGYIFVTWVGDHSPRHVHVFKNSQLVCKFDLENRLVMKGRMSSIVKSWIWQLEKKGLL